MTGREIAQRIERIARMLVTAEVDGDVLETFWVTDNIRWLREATGLDDGAVVAFTLSRSVIVLNWQLYKIWVNSPMTLESFIEGMEDA